MWTHMKASRHYRWRRRLLNYNIIREQPPTHHIITTIVAPFIWEEFYTCMYVCVFGFHNTHMQKYQKRKYRMLNFLSLILQNSEHDFCMDEYIYIFLGVCALKRMKAHTHTHTSIYGNVLAAVVKYMHTFKNVFNPGQILTSVVSLLCCCRSVAFC